ncbi:uncharacterized protein LOC100901772 [Galendromus occidentalis]|uniref:Mitochondria-eating protein n=1 Tax=Galendromus occidentalis TaxID=34638 RepID=A0AAJ7P9V3_9ACAR|nr:uncharacterized protein LOC100901772 [Galendromus occidentalis]
MAAPGLGALNSQPVWQPGSGENRFKPERAATRRNVQKLTWRSSHWQAGFQADSVDAEPPSTQARIQSMTISDVSPGLAIRRILRMYESAQHKEAANFINRLNQSTFRSILSDLPIEVFIETMPSTLPMLEAIYAKVFLADGIEPTLKPLKPDAVVFQMVKLFASCHQDSAPLAPQDQPSPTCKKLLKVIILSEPQLRATICRRKRAFDRAIQSLGQHGLVGTSDDALMNLHDALKLEFERILSQYKSAVGKLDELSLAPKTPVARSLSHGPAPTKASHQRQLSLKQGEIQERLIKNQSLLNVLYPALSNHRNLEILLGVLQRRIDFDKDVLFQFTQLRKEAKDVDGDASVVSQALMRYSWGCQKVIDLMKEVEPQGNPTFDDHEDDSSTDLSAGYHSDSDSNCARSSNLISNSKNVSSQHGSGPSPSSRSASSTTPAVAWDPPNVQSELEALRLELEKARQTINSMQQNEQQLKQRLAAAPDAPRSGSSDKSSSANCTLDKRPSALIRRYGSLYAQARIDTLDALEKLPQLSDCDELKSKLLFSVVVLAFRSVQNTIADMKSQVRRALRVKDAASDPYAEDLEASVELYLRSKAEDFDVTKNIQDVCQQILATLYDYPCLKDCRGLITYVGDSVRLAWALSTQTPPYRLEFETRTFRSDYHVRFHSSNQSSEHIRTYLWPALMEAENGPCVHKGVVIT